MPTYNTIVSYDSILRHFAGRDQLLTRAHEAARSVIGDPARADWRMGQFTTGLDALHKAAQAPRILHTPRDPMGALLQTHIAREGVKEDKLDQFLLHAIEGIKEFFEVRLSPNDWFGWAASFFTWIEGIEKAKQPKADAAATAVPNDFGVAVLGDWGSGLYGAPVCARSIVEGQDSYGMLLHLGDVYYAATSEEVQDRFFRFWPHRAGAINRALNGNHEMYNGGHSYFEEILPNFGQTSSYFALQNDHWVLAGLDTSYSAAFGGHEGNIDDEQVKWLLGIAAAASGRKLVLFSHHQPFTLLDSNSGGNLFRQLKEILEAGRVFAWYWGHEHYCVLYDRHPDYGFYGRCIGHGGIPETRKALTDLPQSPSFGSQWRRLEKSSTAPAAWVYDKANLYVPGFEEQFAPHGYVRLEFQDAKIGEFVRTPEGANVWIGDLT
jgi:hypothetical protein